MCSCRSMLYSEGSREKSVDVDLSALICRLCLSSISVLHLDMIVSLFELFLYCDLKL